MLWTPGDSTAAGIWGEPPETACTGTVGLWTTVENRGDRDLHPDLRKQRVIHNPQALQQLHEESMKRVFGGGTSEVPLRA